MLAIFWTSRAYAQFPPVTSPDSQRTALNRVRSQVNFLENATRTAPGYGQQGYGLLGEQFTLLREAYNGLKQTLYPQQLARGANALAELDAGLDIIQEAFANFQNDLAAGRQFNSAMRDLCDVLRQGSRVWLQQMNKTSSQLRLGWG